MTLFATKKIAAIVGPTACGKTAVSIEAAKRLGAEIVSADSVQIYRGLDIGSAKPDDAERSGVPHHMLDVLPPGRDGFSVAEYQRMAFACIEDIASRGQIPLIVGGTGLYVASLTQAMEFTDAVSDETFRAQWLQRERETPCAAHRELSRVDPASAARLHPNDTKRIVRALEIQHATGKTIGEHAAADRQRPPRYPSVIAGLTMPRAMLYERIEARVESMRNTGLVREVEALLESGVDPASTSMQGLGYKEIAQALLTTQPDSRERDAAIDAAFAQIVLGTRHYAKRQWTWFRRDARIRWFDVSEYESVDAVAKDVAAYMARDMQGSESPQ